MSLYRLEGHVPVLCKVVGEWGMWFETADRVVAFTKIGDSEVSTIFLGIDRNWTGRGPPVGLFESMVFGGPLDREQKRYATWEDAETGHAELVARVVHSQR